MPNLLKARAPVRTPHVYSNSSGTCVYNSRTGEGTSYGWYKLAARVEGIQLLNVYNYSNTTVKHVNQLRSTLRDLGIEFETIEAPLGLQDLEGAFLYEIAKQAQDFVASEHARDVGSRPVGTFALTGDRVATFKRLGYKGTRDQLEKAYKTAVARRENHLKMERERRRLAREKSRPVPKVETPQHVEYSGLRLVR